MTYLCVEWDVKPYTLTHSLTAENTAQLLQVLCRKTQSFVWEENLVSALVLS